MKFDFKGLLTWFIVIYFLNGPLKGIFLNGHTSFFSLFGEFKGWVIIPTGLFSFFLFSLMAYSAFYFFFQQKKWTAFSMLMLASIIFPIAIRFLLQEVLLDLLFGITNYTENYGLWNYFKDNLYFAVAYITFAVIYFFIQFSRFKDKREQQLAIANQQMELSLLRSQINPHFLLNSMNNIYSLVFQKSDLALKAIDMLSNILKYSLYESKEEVTLKEEIEYLNNYIELQKMRFDYETAIKIEVPETLLHHKVPQFLLIPLIENGFKHGDLRDQDHPFYLLATYYDKNINFTASNKKRKHQMDDTGGIGIENIRKRLKLLFGEDHHFDVQETETNFTINISIPVI